MGNIIPRDGISHPQYADDTMIMVEGSYMNLINLKFPPLCFEETSRLQIKFTKSEVLAVG